MQSPTRSEKKCIATKFLNEGAAQNLQRYETYLKYYENVLLGPACNFSVHVDRQAYLAHSDVISSLDRLISRPSQTKEDFSETFRDDIGEMEMNYAIRALLRVAFMIDCASKEDLPEGYKVRDFMPRSWGEDQSFAEFTETCFPSPKHDVATRARILSVLGQRHSLKAWKLKERYKIKLRPTNDLAEHLVFDRERRTIKIFRHVGFLKAHLYRSRNETVHLGFQESLEMGTLPPQLLLETLDSIQYLLFPNDEKSAKSLDKFIQKYSFDPDAKYLESHIRELPDDFEYKYLGDRLLALFDIVDNPPPANWIVAWFERHTTERNALTVAILGLFLTALFGFLSLIIGIVSAAYSIMQYNVAKQALSAQLATSG